jgi:RNA polymerase sigma-70 factor (ECF subfamily)
MLLVIQDDQLPVREARNGQTEAWDALFKRYQRPLYTYVFELTHQEQTSLEIVQETFINAARHIGALREDRKFGSWLFGIAHQKCAQHWRKQRPEPIRIEDEEEIPDSSIEGPDEMLIREEQEAEFMNALNQLSPPHRAVLLLHFMEDFSLEEIAAITGARVGTVKSRLHYAKESLREQLKRESI